MPASWELTPRVLCGILHVDIVPIAWAFGLRKLLPLDMPIMPVTGRPYDHARNSICQTALDHGFEYVFMLDSDVIPPPDTIPRLLAHRKPIISGVYHRRSPPHGLPVMCRNGQFLTQYPANSIIEVDVVGAGCLLIHRSVLEQMQPSDPKRGRHWFDWKVDMAHLLPPGEGMSEDFVFCLKARKELGIPILVDTGIQCRHVGLSEAYFGGMKPCEAVA